MENRTDGWIMASNQSLSFLDETGEVSEVAQLEAHVDLSVRTNDGACDPWGRFWIGSMAFDSAEGHGSLYRFHDSIGVEKIASNISISNGIGWSPDQRTMYYVDSGPGTIHTFDVDENGQIANKRLLVRLNVEREGKPDGLCIDSQGGIWVAIWGGNEVRRYSPSGEQLNRVKLPTSQPSSCAIGGAYGTTLYITTAQEDLPPSTLDAEPDAGRLFCVDVQITGVPIGTYRPTIPYEK
jgi:sugar lactone lactonase YvrE